MERHKKQVTYKDQEPVTLQSFETIHLENLPTGWRLFINNSKHGIPASNVEVFLWLQIQNLTGKS